MCSDIFGPKFDLDLLTTGVRDTNTNYGGTDIQVEAFFESCQIWIKIDFPKKFASLLQWNHVYSNNSHAHTKSNIYKDMKH